MNETEKMTEVATEALENIGTEVTEVTELPPTQSSSGLATIIGGVAAGAGLIFGGVKLSQKIYDKRCEKNGIATPERERWFQFWRKKAKKTKDAEPKVIPMPQRASVDDKESDN